MALAGTGLDVPLQKNLYKRIKPNAKKLIRFCEFHVTMSGHINVKP